MIAVPFLRPEQRFDLGEGSWSPRDVIAALGPWITPRRIEKIERVVQGRRLGVTTVLDSVYDRGNQSAVIRSAEGLGFPWVHVIETQEKTKEANRVTLGADKWVHIDRWANTRDCIRVLKHYDFQIVATDLTATTTLDEIDYSVPTALVFGNEKIGVSEEILKVADRRAVLPMSGFTQSFNLSVAAALCLAHARAKLTKTDLTERQMDVLRAQYFIKSVPHASLIMKAYRPGLVPERVADAHRPLAHISHVSPVVSGSNPRSAGEIPSRPVSGVAGVGDLSDSDSSA